MIDPGTFSINLTVPLDVIIGTIPLFNYLPLATSFPPPGTSQLNNWSIPTATREDLTASARELSKFYQFKGVKSETEFHSFT